MFGKYARTVIRSVGVFTLEVKIKSKEKEKKKENGSKEKRFYTK